MKPARTFQDLLVWQKAHRFVLEVYAFTALFPKHETYGLSLQMRRAAVSIPANNAEGFRRRSKLGAVSGGSNGQVLARRRYQPLYLLVRRI